MIVETNAIGEIMFQRFKMNDFDVGACGTGKKFEDALAMETESITIILKSTHYY